MPALGELIRKTHAAGASALQLCENARIRQRSPAEWREALAVANDLGLQLGIGAMSLEWDHIVHHLDLASTVSTGTVRLILECDDGLAASETKVKTLLDRLVPELDSRNLRLAIENHFDLPCAWLNRVVADYPGNRLGFCFDAANSLRNWESPEQVLTQLLPRAFQFHFKDYVVVGSNVGFSVHGVPFGQGQLPGSALLERVLASQPDPEIYVETWTPSSGDVSRDIAEDERYLSESLLGFRRLVERLADGTGTAKATTGVNRDSRFQPPETGFSA